MQLVLTQQDVPPNTSLPRQNKNPYQKEKREGSHLLEHTETEMLAQLEEVGLLRDPSSPSQGFQHYSSPVCGGVLD